MMLLLYLQLLSSSSTVINSVPCCRMGLPAQNFCTRNILGGRKRELIRQFEVTDTVKFLLYVSTGTMLSEVSMLVLWTITQLLDVNYTHFLHESPSTMRHRNPPPNPPKRARSFTASVTHCRYNTTEALYNGTRLITVFVRRK